MPQRRKPEHLRVLHGTEKARVNPRLPDINNAPNPPTWLPSMAKREWRRVLGLCKRYEGWLQAVDRAALTGYCSSWAIFEEASKDIAERGVMVTGRSSADKVTGARVKNPAIAVARDAQTSLRYWCRELGFTPDARGKLDLSRFSRPSTLDDDLDDLDFDALDPRRLLS
ncbi:MAG: phage terminase small subunit P27 family [Actinomycetota bacterium]